MAATAFFDVAQAALECVCAAMNDLTGTEDVPTGYACPCLVYVSAGPPAVDCCNVDCTPGGMLTVHVEDVYASEDFPVRSTAFQPCKAATWVAAIVVTAARCERIKPDLQPDPDDLTAAALIMAVDQWAIVSALGCCLVADNIPNKRIRRVQIVGTRPQTSEGGCASVEVRALVEAGRVCNCPPEVS
jgi:hypothetical protein